MRKIIYYFLLALGLNSCIGEDIIDDTQTMNERISIVSGNTFNDTLFVGESQRLRAEFYDINGNVVESSNLWTSSKPSVASVDQDGKVTALESGAANIKVTSNGVEDERLIVVRQLERIEIKTASLPSVMVGDSILLSADYYSNRGELTPSMPNWSIDTRTIATLRTNGDNATLIGNSTGAVIVKASFNGIEGEISISVIDDTNSVASIKLETNTTAIDVGSTLQLQATLFNINGTELNNRIVNFNSSDASVLTVDNNGLATAVSPGSATITAQSENATSNGISVLVNQTTSMSRSGTFSGRGGYSVSGTVKMEEVNGNLQLNFTNFSSSNGPGLYIYLSNSVSSGISIEALNRRSGNFTVSLPSNITIDDYNYVLIWCQPFGVTFGSALLN